MSPVIRAASSASLLGGSIVLPAGECHHAPARHVRAWIGETGTSGTVAVVGAGKMGLPLAAQFASHGWKVIAIDIDPSVVAAINEGRSHIGEEPGVADLVAEAHRAGRLRATLDGSAAAAEADVVVLIVPVMLDATNHPDRRSMDAAVTSIGAGLRAGSTVILETTLPVGDTRDRYAPMLAEASGLAIEEDLFVAFSPERLYSGAALRNLATYPKLVGGLGEASTARAAAFYSGVLDADVVALSSAEAAEFAKLADTTYRDVNIALANEFARYADRIGVDILEVDRRRPTASRTATSTSPGSASAGTASRSTRISCSIGPPRWSWSDWRDGSMTGKSMSSSTGWPRRSGRSMERPVLVLGLTYREGVKELAYSRALPLISGLRERGARALAFDPLLTASETERTGARAWSWGEVEPDVAAIVTQTADPAWRAIDPAWFPSLRSFVDGRNSLRDLVLPEGVDYRGIGGRR